MGHNTKPHRRPPPPRRFENYVLTRILDSSAGLTNVPDALFTQAPGTTGQGYTDDAYIDPPISIGFTFNFDGIDYKNFTASTNGWMVLVDPSRSTFNSTEVLSSAQWVNNIRSSFAYRHVLLAPWFDDNRNVANDPSQLANPPFNYSATKIARINAGLEPPPIFYNPTSYGVSYYVESRGPHGRRLIVRWAVASNFSSPSSVIRFEVVLYENGTIEYRYVPRQTIFTPVSVVESATIGIFMHDGPWRFRDFSAGLGYRENSRQEYIYGGYVYDATYLDNGFPYTYNLRPDRNWPGLHSAGCIMRFSPPQNRRKILPRKLVSERDSRTSFPNALRTGTPIKNIYRPYDDRKSPEYSHSRNLQFDFPSPRATLDNLSWRIPRISDWSTTSYNVVDPAPVTAVMPGTSGTVLYDVTLRFRGVVEQKTYIGGTNDGAFFQTGGTPALDDWNVYQLSISDPTASYFLNRGTSGLATIHAIDYTKTIRIAAGATVRLTAATIDNREIANNSNTGGPLSIDGITDPAQPFAGQFIVMNFMGATVVSSSLEQATISTSSIQVNYPTTMNRFFGGSGLGTSERQNLFSGDFLVTGTIVKSAIDQYVDETPQLYAEAFNESSRPDQGPTAAESSFFTTGSSFEYLPQGFDQNLRSKTQVRITLPVNTNVTMPDASSSIYYYNKRAKAWEVPANSTYVLSTAGTTPPAGTTAGDWKNPSSDVTNGRIVEDARGFGPIGNAIASGSGTPTGMQQTDSVIGSPFNNTLIPLIVGKEYAKSVRNNEHYRANNDETFELPINTPFLIEKAVFEIPITAGPGWFNDRTQCFMPFIGGSSYDFAGPALTVALSRQVMLSEKGLTSVRDLIMTGTIIPSGDNVNRLEISNFPAFSSTYQIRPVGFLAYAGPPGAVVTPQSNNTFTGSVQVQSTALNTAGIAVRYIRNFADASANNRTNVIGFLTRTPTLILSNSLNVTASVGYVAPLGRGGTGFAQSGRAIMGKEYALLQGRADRTGKFADNPFATGTLSAQHSTLLTTSVGTFNAVAHAIIPVMSHFPSPYLVMPGDKLVLSISKMRPVMYGGTGAQNWFSGSSHDIKLSTGNINITLYGSLVREGVEFHDPLNQNISSNVVHELIGAEPVLDQFTVAYRHEYTGSYTDDVVLGTLTSDTGRDRKLSRLNARNVAPLGLSPVDVLLNPFKSFRAQPWYEKIPDVRYVSFTDSSERFWDSMMPGVAESFRRDGSSIFVAPGGTFGDFRQVDVDITSSISTFDPKKTRPGWIFLDYVSPSLGSQFMPIVNGNWNRSFPFEPRYAGVSRQLDTGQSLIATYIYDPHPLAYPHVFAITPQTVNGLIFGTRGLGTAVVNFTSWFGIGGISYLKNTPVYQWFADSNLVSKVNNPSFYQTAQSPAQMYATGAMPNDDTNRVLFGFGDRNTIYYEGSTMLGTNHFPEHRDVEGPHPDGVWTYYDISNFHYSPVIRGWKYGVYSGLPAYSKAYFRRDRFGQYRDMLEQRPFTKFYQTPQGNNDVSNFQQGVQPAAVTVTFLDPSSGRLTAPENTWSSNLHFECTSSMPFFDGIALNRPTINPANLNLHPNVIKSDGNGNIQIS